ncbi:MAG: hypothetical protein QOJ50_168 [Cryptosporangiaceae bacterium]|nr:hypothetical protein [Cryptosporangiaceae bacterium]
MGAALRGLTTRGRSFLAAAAAAAVSALFLGEKDIFRVAALLALLPLLAAVVVARSRYRLSCTRTLTPNRVQAGTPCQVVLTLQNLSRLPTGLMLLEDQVPYALGSRPRFVLSRLIARQASQVSYTVRADARGRYVLGPLSVRLTDPFGLCELTRSFTSTERLVVTPVVTPLPPVRVSGEWAGNGESRARSIAVHGEDDAATREYRHGDDLRKVHWRSTARTGEMMVRREEQPWHTTATLLLDTRSSAHRGDGPASSFEWAISAAASVGVHLGRSGYTTRLVTDTELDLSAAALGGEGVLLDFLAEVRPSKHATLADGIRRLRRDTSGLVIALTGFLSPEEAQLLAASRPTGTTNIAVLVDAASWVGLPGPQRAAADERYNASVHTLLLGGWRVLRAAHGSRLDALWPYAATRGGQGAPSSTSPTPASPGARP